MNLVSVVFGVLAFAAPPLTLFLLWRQHKLRQQLLYLEQLGVQQN